MENNKILQTILAILGFISLGLVTIGQALNNLKILATGCIVIFFVLGIYFGILLSEPEEDDHYSEE